jgi:hypothetical protein
MESVDPVIGRTRKDDRLSGYSRKIPASIPMVCRAESRWQTFGRKNF